MCSYIQSSQNFLCKTSVHLRYKLLKPEVATHDSVDCPPCSFPQPSLKLFKRFWRPWLADLGAKLSRTDVKEQDWHPLFWSADECPSHLSLFVSSQLKMFASFDGQHPLWAAVGLHTLQPQHNLLCGFSLHRNTSSMQHLWNVLYCKQLKHTVADIQPALYCCNVSSLRKLSLSMFICKQQSARWLSQINMQISS